MTAPLTPDPYRSLVAPTFDLNDDQLGVLTSIMDTFVARLTEQEIATYLPQEDPALAKEFGALTISSMQAWPIVKAFMNRCLAADKRQEVSMILSVLSTRAGTFVLTGGYTERFQDLSRQDREKIIINWKNSYLPPLRLLYKLFFSSSCHPVYGALDSPLAKGMGYPGADPVRASADYKPVNTPERLPMMTPQELKDGLKFDVIVVGSGAGGGVAAAELAKAGKSVLVIDKGKYYHEDDFDLRESAGFVNLYEYGGFFSTYEGSVNVLAGSVFGGGTTVNWSASLKLQHFVREEWAKQGLSHFMSPKFARDLDRVFERIGATTSGVKHNATNGILVQGCQALGYHVADIAQNTGGQAHDCNFCFTGCRDGIKNGTMNTWLRDAHQHGARFLDRTKVERVIIENGRAVGVECTAHYEHKAIIRAEQVVVSGGSLHTPNILARSGLKNKNIGQHLRLHPCSIAFGFFDHDINMYEGSIMTAVSNVVENLDGDGYGAKIEVPCLHPGSYSTVLPWRGAAHHKSLMMRYRKCCPLLILSRDKDSKGVVRSDDKGNMVVDFDLSSHDRNSILQGIIRTLHILTAAGARELHTGQFGVEPFIFEKNEESSVDNPRFKAWIEQVTKYGLPKDGAGIFCAHQMGTCRMGISPKVSVTKPTGETWEVKDLFVADASLFPTASGVNPMITTEALALHVADTIVNKATPAKL